MASDAVRRVAMFSLHSSPLAPLGGADAGGMNYYVYRLALELGERGLQVDVFTRRTDGHVADTVSLGCGARLIHLSAGPHRPLPKSVLPLHLPAMVNAFRRFMVREQAEYQVLHSHYWMSGLAAARYRVQSNDEVPLVHMFHTLAKLKAFYSGTEDADDSALRSDGERCLIGRADTVVGATEAELQDMSRLYARTPAHFAVIPPGVDLEVFRPHGRVESRRQLRIDADRVILFVGRLDRLKGVDVLLRAAASLPAGIKHGLKIVLVGGEPASTTRSESRHHALARRLGLAEIVEFRGKVPQSQLPAYYSAADICAVPSAYESFGMVATEAMACQTPPVAFAVGGLAATIVHGRTGFLATPGNNREYSARLLEGLTSERLDEMGRRARITVQRYTWSLTADRTQNLYREVASEYAHRTGVQFAAR